jgi:hypothetical protein
LHASVTGGSTLWFLTYLTKSWQFWLNMLLFITENDLNLRFFIFQWKYVVKIAENNIHNNDPIHVSEKKPQCHKYIELNYKFILYLGIYV